jgi:hypothetical protein
MAGLNFDTSFQDIIGGVGGIFGTSDEQSGNTVANATGEQRKKLELDQEAITKIIDDLLSTPDGLAAIFAGEQNAGVFNSSVAAQAAGDLSANIVGELAKLTATEVTTTEQAQSQSTSQEAKKGGVLDGIGDFLGF